MNKRIPIAMVAIAAAVAAPVARADYTFQLDPAPIFAPASLGFANSTASGLLAAGTVVPNYNFLDTWNFTLGAGADVGSFVGSLNFVGANGAVTQGISNLQLRLVGPNTNIIGWQSALNYGGVTQVFSIITATPFAAGDYSLQVRGLLQGGASAYAGTLSAVSPVPLPPAAPMAAAGLALVAIVARRRRRPS